VSFAVVGSAMQRKMSKTRKGQDLQKCYNSTRERTRTCHLQLHPPVRSHKRQGTTNRSANRRFLSSIIPPVSPQLALHDRDTWNTHRWKMIRGNRARRVSMTDWSRLVKETGSGAFNGWEEKRAGFYEQNMRQSLSRSILEQQRVRIVTSAENLARRSFTPLVWMNLPPYG
jgi:hypothetical protein